jgi:hydrogenase-4 component E
MNLLDTLTMLLLAVAIFQAMISHLKLAVNVLVLQSVIVAGATAAIGFQTGDVHEYIAAALTIVVKCIVIPYALYRVVPRLHQEREEITSRIGLALCFFSIILAGGLIKYGLPGIEHEFTLTGAVALILIGLVLIMTRHQAMLQTVGVITMENGIYLVGLSITKGLPLIIELGVFFDVLVAVVVLGILTSRLKVFVDTTDTRDLRNLKG